MVPVGIATAPDAELFATCDGAVPSSAETPTTAPIPAAVKRTPKHIVRIRLRLVVDFGAFSIEVGKDRALFA